MKKLIVIFSGAGLSAESGIPTFRDSNGLWHNHKVEDVATLDGWLRDRKLVLNFYKDRNENIKACLPNPGHAAIAELQEKYRVVNITQNIDDLLERAGCEEVWHLHGSIFQRKCENYSCDYKSISDLPVAYGDLCPKCQKQLRPDVVWFGEEVDMRDKELQQLIDNTSVFIGVGTSAQVNPAAFLLWHFRNTPKKYFIDIKPSARLQSFTRLAGKASELLPQVAKELLGQTWV